MYEADRFTTALRRLCVRFVLRSRAGGAGAGGRPVFAGRGNRFLDGGEDRR